MPGGARPEGCERDGRHPPQAPALCLCAAPCTAPRNRNGPSLQNGRVCSAATLANLCTSRFECWQVNSALLERVTAASLANICKQLKSKQMRPLFFELEQSLASGSGPAGPAHSVCLRGDQAGILGKIESRPRMNSASAGHSTGGSGDARGVGPARRSPARTQCVPSRLPRCPHAQRTAAHPAAQCAHIQSARGSPR